MFEKLDKLRADLDRAKQRRAEADAKVKALEEKLQEAENSQVLADVSALKLTPEQVAQLLQLAASGQLPMNGTAGQSVGAVDPVKREYGTDKTVISDDDNNEDLDEENMEDFDNEDN